MSFREEPMHPSYSKFTKKETNENLHQKGIKHNDTCRCNQYKLDDLVVMYEHLDQYPAHYCYCKFCLGKLQMDLIQPKEDVKIFFEDVLKIKLQQTGIDLK